MSNKHIFEELNEQVFGNVMMATVRRAIGAIRNQRFTFESVAKRGLNGAMDDIVTTADRAAQSIYVQMKREHFPFWGIVAEEDGLAVACRMDGVDAYITVDPLDGTKALVRRQTHGIGTMVASVVNERVTAAYVGDVSTQVIYGYGPNSPHVHCVSDIDATSRLCIDVRCSLAVQDLTVRKDCELYSPLLRKFLHPNANTHRKREKVNGSIGLSFARLWQGEVGGAVMERGATTPWDLTPIVGISERLGFVFLRCTETDFVPYRPLISKKIEHVDFDTLIVHESRVGEVREALRRIKA